MLIQVAYLDDRYDYLKEFQLELLELRQVDMLTKKRHNMTAFTVLSLPVTVTSVDWPTITVSPVASITRPLPNDWV